MSKTLYEELVDEFDTEKSYRETYVEPRWKETVQLVMPRYGTFGTDAPWSDNRFDSTATESSQLLADAMFGNLCPADSKWFRYIFADDRYNQSKNALILLEEMSMYMLNVFNRSTFYDVGPEYLQIGNSIATASMEVVYDETEEKIVCMVDHPRSTYVKTDAKGAVVAVYTRKYLTADMAAAEFGEENLDDASKQSLSTNDREEYEFVMCVRLRRDAKPGSKLAREWKWGIYVFRTDDKRKTFIYEGGSKTMPKAVWRWALRGNESYGWGPIDDAMPDIRTCNQLVRSMLMVVDKQSDPATYFPEEGRMWSNDPGKRNYYRDPNRRPFKDEIAGYRFDWEALQQFQMRIRKSMKIDHFLMLMQQEQTMTAREVAERKREGLSVVSSTVGKFETDALDMIHARFIQIEADGKRLPGFREGEVLPPELRGADLKVEYLGPIPQQQKLVALEQGVLSAVEASISVFKLWPETLAKVKAHILIDRIWRANGVTEDSLRSDKEYTALLAEKAKAAMEAQKAAVQAEVAGGVDPNVPPAPGSPAAAMTGA